jgi:hypothetical protein
MAVDRVDLFKLVALRAPVPVDGTSKTLVRDDVPTTTGRRAAALFSKDSVSEIAREIYDIIFCHGSSGGLPGSEASESGVIVAVPIENPAAFVQMVLARLTRIDASCPPNPGELEALADRRYLNLNGRYFIIPDELDALATPYAQRTRALIELVISPPTSNGELDLKALVHQICDLLGAASLLDAVYAPNETTYAGPFGAAKRELFDRLYLLYVAFRSLRTRVSLERTLLALGALHVVETLANDQVVGAMQATPTARVAALFAMIAADITALGRWDRQSPAPGFPAIATRADLARHLHARAVVHPIFAQLHRFRRPFNTLQPVGIADLKVVKQWLCGYRVGEIAHVENVLAGETKTRQHRRLERSVDTLRYASERTEDIEQDQQSTDRFELKRESEAVLATDLNINARASVTYRGGPVVAEVGGGMAFNQSQNEVRKSAENFSREVVSKAVSRIQSRVAEERTTMRTFETEENTKHELTNPPANPHITGLYRWLEKVYRAQLYNYGKRMMFELVLPEPAAFLVESRLKAFEASVDVPTPPTLPEEPMLEMPLVMPLVGTTPVPLASPGQITEANYNDLRTQFDLAHVPFRPLVKRAFVIDPATASTTLSRAGLLDNRWSSVTYRTDMKADGYEVTGIKVDGYGHAFGRGEPADVGAAAHNKVIFYVQGSEVGRWEADADYYNPALHPALVPAAPIPCHGDDVVLTIGTQDMDFFDLSVSIELALGTQALLDWRTAVFIAVRDAQQRIVDEERVRRRRLYEADLITYKNRLEQLRATAVGELLQGRAPARNREIVRDELKRQCLAMLSKEFDADGADDILGRVDLLGRREIDMTTRRFEVTEQPSSAAPTSVVAGFTEITTPTSYAAPHRERARLYGRYIQFLEQAFEWEQLSFIAYPYFWTTAPRWVELMNRDDPADPAFASFLQAGSVKVLLAVTPAYDHAVLHYLATGEPWDGGPAPVIGDPLYVPLYEELRQQQDDLAGATPDGPHWTFTVPTSLVYLENSTTPLPASVCVDPVP